MDERVDHAELKRAEPSVSHPVARRRSWLRPLLVLLLLVVAGYGIAMLLHRQPQRSARNGTTPQPVGAATIGTGDIRIMLNELGTVTPLDVVTVQSQINGTLMSVGFKEGQVVQKGDFLAQIDDRPYQAQLLRDQGTLAHDQGLLAQARADLQRYATLNRQDSIAKQQVQDQHFVVQQDQGTVQADQAAVHTDEINIAYCHITAPVTGRVGLLQIDPGNYVTPSSTTGIVVITQMQPMSVLFSIPQQDIDAVQERMATGAKLPVTAFDQANTRQIDQGTLATVDNQMDTTTGTVKLRAIFPNAKNQLFPNQFVNAHLLVNTLSNVVRVPVAAVQLGPQGSFVWLIGANNTVSAQPVKLGAVDGQYQQVISGLKTGDRVVTDGTDRLRDGMKVTIPTSPPPSGNAASATPAAAPAKHAGGHRGGQHPARPATGTQPG